MVNEATKSFSTSHLPLSIALIITALSSLLFTPQFLLSSSLSPSSSPLPGWNVAVWASVDCGLSAVVASTQSQQDSSAGCSRLPPR